MLLLLAFVDRGSLTAYVRVVNAIWFASRTPRAPARGFYFVPLHPTSKMAVNPPMTLPQERPWFSGLSEGLGQGRFSRHRPNVWFRLRCTDSAPGLVSSSAQYCWQTTLAP